MSEVITDLGSIGTFITSILTLITLIRVITRMKYKEEVIYGKEATKKINNVKDNLTKIAILVDSHDFEGGTATIIPKLEFEKFVYNPLIMEPELKKCKRKVAFYEKDGEKRTVTTWYLK